MFGLFSCDERPAIGRFDSPLEEAFFSVLGLAELAAAVDRDLLDCR
jgi:hypothetical protein